MILQSTRMSCWTFWGQNEKFCEASVLALEHAASEGSLVICDLVYAELCIHFNTQGECDRFLRANEIRVEPLNVEAHFLASRVRRACRKQVGQRARACYRGIADFIGSCFLN